MAMFRAGILLAVLLVCGCAPATIAPEQMQGIRRVAVISAIGDKFTVKKVGITVFGNDEKDFAIDAWGIDDFVVSKVRSVLAGRFEVRPVAYQKAAFAASKSSFPLVAGVEDIPVPKIAEALRAQATSPDIDAYVVITKSGSALGNTNQSVHGLGILAGSSLMGTSVYMYALYQVTVVDGHSFAVVATSPAFPLGQTVLSMQAIRGPSREVDESWMPATLDAAQNTRLKSAVTDLLDRNLPGTIANLKLLQ
jgi:hypothetical protein